MLSNPETKICPFCGEEIKFDAIKCRFCNAILNDNSSHSSPEKQVDIKVDIVFDKTNKEQCASKRMVKKYKCQYLGAIIKLFISLTIISIICYYTFNYTEFGKQTQEIYMNRVLETENLIENNFECIRLYIAYKNTPPMSLEEVRLFNVECQQKQQKMELVIGHTLLSFPNTLKRVSIEDAFDNQFLYNVDISKRKIYITSTGPLGIYGIKNISRELSY